MSLINILQAQHNMTPITDSQLLSINLYPSHESSLIDKWIDNSELQDKLDNILRTNTGRSTLTFYTDGSLIDRGLPNCKMGSAWVQTDGTENINTF